MLIKLSKTHATDVVPAQLFVPTDVSQYLKLNVTNKERIWQKKLY